MSSSKHVYFSVVTQQIYVVCRDVSYGHLGRSIR